MINEGKQQTVFLFVGSKGSVRYILRDPMHSARKSRGLDPGFYLSVGTIVPPLHKVSLTSTRLGECNNAPICFNRRVTYSGRPPKRGNVIPRRLSKDI